MLKPLTPLLFFALTQYQYVVPDVAVVSGSVTYKSGGTSGNGAYLSGDDGNLYYYFHLDSYADVARRVAQGEVIGYVGNTGDARYTATHTHFEIHPGHGESTTVGRERPGFEAYLRQPRDSAYFGDVSWADLGK